MALFSKENFSKEKLKKFAADARDIIKKRWWVMLIELAALALLLVADLVSKQYVVPFLMGQPGHTYKLIPGFIHLTYSENTGAGFGFLSGNTTLLIIVTFVVVIGLIIFLIFAQKQNEWLRASLLLIAGGGIGNLVDRVGLGYVRDFIDYAFLKNFAICNVADVFVTVGAVMLIVVLIVMLVREGRKNQKEFEKEQAGKAQEQGTDPLDAPINLNPMLSSPNDYTFDEGATSLSETSDLPSSEETSGHEKDLASTAENAPEAAENIPEPKDHPTTISETSASNSDISELSASQSEKDAPAEDVPEGK